MSGAAAVAVLDIGKSNSKLALIDRASRSVIAIRTMRNRVLTAPPYPHFDVDGTWKWLLAGLSEFSALANVEVISTTTHGGAFAVLKGDGLALAVLDYEFGGPDSVSAEYALARGSFDEILSPDLVGGLNTGRQLYWQARAFPEAFRSADTILPYPQYWVFRLTGERICEPTCFGAHTDLWNGRTGTFSALADREGWTRRFPRLAAPWDVAGTLLPGIAASTGLPADCRVVAGIHDSNASLLPHILWRPPPFSVVSTGTWMITFAPGGRLDDLRPDRGGLAYVDAFGRPVPSVMSMAGREFERLTDGAPAEPDEAAIEAVIGRRIMALPAIVAGSGPFGSRRGGWTVDPAPLSPAERTTAASLYAALVAEACLAIADARGPVLVEGPFAQNRLFLSALAALVPRPVIGRPDATGTTEGAALLADGPGRRAPETADPPAAVPLGHGFAVYAAAWKAAAAT